LRHLPNLSDAVSNKPDKKQILTNLKEKSNVTGDLILLFHQQFINHQERR